MKKEKSFFLPFDRQSDLKKLWCSKSLFFLVCLLFGFWHFISLQFYCFCPGVWQNLTVWFQGLGQLWNQHENQDEGFCSGGGGGISDWWKGCALNQLADILAEHEHLKRTGQVYHCLKQYRRHLWDQIVFEPSLPHSLIAAMGTDKNSVCPRLIHSVPGYSAVLLGQTFPSLPSSHCSAEEASQSLCVSSANM